MASFTITSGTALGPMAGQALGAASTALGIFGILGPLFKAKLEVSPDNVISYVAATMSDELNNIGSGKDGGAVCQCMLPAGWYVRVNIIAVDPTTAATVAVA